MILHIFSGLLISYITISLLEYYIHKYGMHRPGWINKFGTTLFTNHQKIHHPAYRKNFQHPNPEEHALIGLDISYFYSIKFFIIPLIMIGFFFPVEVIIFNIMLAAHHYFWNLFHLEMHQPANRLFCNNFIFRYLSQYHEIHHLYPKCNFNAIFIGPDFLFGTYKNETY